MSSALFTFLWKRFLPFFFSRSFFFDSPAVWRLLSFVGTVGVWLTLEVAVDSRRMYVRRPLVRYILLYLGPKVPSHKKPFLANILSCGVVR